MPMYESDLTRFLRQLFDKEPALETLQVNNRATWWDRSQDLDAQRRYQESEAPKAPYAYFPLPSSPEASASADAQKNV